MSTQHWDSFWQSSATLNSFAEGTAALGYQGEILSHWHSVFSALPEDAVIVDVGTGNGAIALAAQEYSQLHNKHFKISGIDAANINPLKVFEKDSRIASLLANIQFYPVCKTEQMPFTSASVDLLTSQFAFEYAEQKSAVKECVRVLKPGAKFVAIIHHSDSDISKDSQRGMHVLSQFLHKTPFFVVAGQLVSLLSNSIAAPDDNELTTKSRVLNKQLLLLAEQIKKGLTDVEMSWFQDVMANMAKILMNFRVDHKHVFERYHSSLEAFYLRLSEQQAAALTELDVQLLKQSFMSYGGNCSVEALCIDGNLFGWLCDYKK